MVFTTTAAPTVFGNEILSHPQHEEELTKLPTQMLQDCATAMATRLGDGIEDVSFREFVDLVLTVSGRTSAISILVEQDISNRKTSILRSIYFSFLETKLQDPPEGSSKGIKVVPDILAFPEDENEETCCKTSNNDRPIPSESASRTSTITAISWSSASAFEIVDDDSPEFADSFQFVSDFDTDDEESLDSEDDRSMVVFLEKEQENKLCRRSIRTPANIGSTNLEDRIDLPHDFQVVTIVDVPDAIHLGRTFSITTNTSAHSGSSRTSSRFSNRLTRLIFPSSTIGSTADAATEATTTAELEGAIIHVAPTGMVPHGENRPTDTIASTLSSTFEKIKRIGTKSTTGEF